MSNSARHNLSYVAEVTAGTTPASPVFKDLSHIACSLGLAQEGSISETIRNDRHIHHFRHGLKQVGGEISGEFAPIAHDDMLAAALQGSWTGSGPFVLKPGTTRQSFTFLREFQDQSGSAERFHRFVGCQIRTLALAFTTKNAASIKMGILGLDLASMSDSAPAGATFGDPDTNEAFTNLQGSIEEGGASIGIVSEISLNIDNGMEPQFVLMQKQARGSTNGRCNLTGSLTAFFETSALLRKFVDSEASSLEFSVIMGDYTYAFHIPRLKYTGGQPDVSGQAEIMLTLPFQASFDDTEETNLIITKTVA